MEAVPGVLSDGASCAPSGRNTRDLAILVEPLRIGWCRREPIVGHRRHVRIRRGEKWFFFVQILDTYDRKVRGYHIGLSHTGAYAARALQWRCSASCLAQRVFLGLAYRQKGSQIRECGI